MKTTEVNYAGLKLRSPIVISSSGLTDTAKKNESLEKAGAGAVVLKSLFEEQILLDSNAMDTSSSPLANDYIQNYLRSNQLSNYLNLIKESKETCEIPVIASINCYTTEGWIDFAHKIELAGADALELNIFPLNFSKKYNDEKFLNTYTDIIRKVTALVSIPVIVKIGQNYNNIIWFVEQLRLAGAKAVVLFNRFYQPDIDIDKMEISLTDAFSDPSELYNTLRWVGIVSGKVPEINIAASTGIHTPEAPIKALLAGATAAKVCSAVYKQGNEIITKMNEKLAHWMQQNGYATISEFRGKLNYANVSNPVEYERIQFMRYVSSKK